MKTLHTFASLGKCFFLPAAVVMLSMTTLLAQPANDLCSNAITVTCGQTVTGNTTTATIDQTPDCNMVFPRYGVWYRFVGTGQEVTLSTCSSATNYDTQIGVYSGSCTALTCVAGNNNFCGRQSQVTFNSVAGTTYFILVTGVVDARGAFSLSVTCTGSAGPANDACAGSVLVSCGQTVTGTTTGATADAVGTCVTALNTAPGVWYRFNGNGDNVTISLCGSSYDTKIGVFSGTCAALVCVAGNDDFCSLQSQVSFSSVSGTTYYILVTGFSTAAGNFTMSVTCTPPPPPSTCNCANTSPWLTVTAPSNTTTLTISTCTYAGEYNTINSAVAGRTYVVTSSVATDYLTVRAGTPNGTAIACGTTPLTFTVATSGTIYLHVNTNSTCGTQNTCRSTTITCTSCTTLRTDANNTIHAFGDQLEVGQVFPNPMVGNTANLRVFSPKETEAVVRFMDQLGRQVLFLESDLNVGENLLQLNTARLAAGTYFVTIQVDGQIITRRLVIPRA